MAYDEGLAERIRDLLADRDDIREKKMFGGIAFLLGGNMCVGVVNDVLMARVGADAYEAMLEEPHARPMDFTGKPLRGFLYIDPEGIDDDEHLARWIERGVAFASSLPMKSA